ncbi:carbohydrate kinase [Alistipes sp.]|uniref:carbohydrate kinase family protein n=1 Tax=Alistipes sp. TaxID=1872444 RepID=UPI0025C6929D|nr:carbohydrate kinase [Alistipes sp.]
MKHDHIIGLGEVLWDMLPEGPKIGGAPANFAWHMAQFGYDAIAASAIGNDADGDAILLDFNERGLRADLARVAYPTGRVEVHLDREGIPQYEILTDVAWDHIPCTERLRELARNARCICFGSLAQRSEVSRHTITALLDETPREALRVFDINLRQKFYDRSVVVESLKRCSILKINDEEAIVVARMLGMDSRDIFRTAEQLRCDFGLQAAILTCGSRGSHVFHEGGVSDLTTPKVEVADTVGAGDSFTAGFCAARLHGCDIAAAHALAVKVSAYVCTCKGATPRLPEELTRFE